jgi:hypothetical protein
VSAVTATTAAYGVHPRRVRRAPSRRGEGHGVLVFLEIILLTVCVIIWLVTMFLVIKDPISAGMKVLWLLALIVLMPFATPAYLLARHLRRPPQAMVG